MAGQIVEPLWGPRAYFLQHLEECAAQRWHFVVDNLDTHRSLVDKLPLPRLPFPERGR